MNNLENIEINNIKIEPIFSLSEELLGLKINQGDKIILYSHQKDKNKVINFLHTIKSDVFDIYLNKQTFIIEDYFDFNYNRVYYINYDVVSKKVGSYALFNNRLV